MTNKLVLNIFKLGYDGKNFFRYNERVEDIELSVKTPSLMNFRIRQELKRISRKININEDFDYVIEEV